MKQSIADFSRFPTAFRKSLCYGAAPLLISIFAALATFDMAKACVIPSSDETFDYFRSAEVILIGNISSYRAVPAEHHAIFEFETVRLITGPGMGAHTPAKWRAEWTNSTFGEPENWTGAKTVIVGLRAKINPRGEPVIYVIQKSCSFSPSLIPASEENLQAILKDSGISAAPVRLKDIPWP